MNNVEAYGNLNYTWIDVWLVYPQKNRDALITQIKYGKHVLGNKHKD